MHGSLTPDRESWYLVVFSFPVFGNLLVTVADIRRSSVVKPPTETGRW